MARYPMARHPMAALHKLYEVEFAGAVRRFGTVVDVEFGVDAFEVLFDGADGDDEFLGDLFVGHPLREKV